MCQPYIESATTHSDNTKNGDVGKLNTSLESKKHGLSFLFCQDTCQCLMLSTSLHHCLQNIINIVLVKLNSGIEH